MNASKDLLLPCVAISLWIGGATVATTGGGTEGYVSQFQQYNPKLPFSNCKWI